VMKDDVEGGLMRAIIQDVPTLDDALQVAEALLLTETETVATVEA
jgi:transcription-repair coupling factor (superfamily II helicase)